MSFSFDTPASAASVVYALGRQPVKGTPATTVEEVIHAGGSEGPGLLVDQGELEVGAGFYTGQNARKVGARPNFDAAGRTRLRSFAMMLEGAGVVLTDVTGGGGTPTVGHFRPAATPAAIPYITYVADYGTVGPRVQQIDSRLAAVELNIIPGQPIQARMAGQGRVHALSALVPVVDANRLEPSVVAPVAAADAVIFGQNDVCFRAVDLLINQILFSDNQCIGEDGPSDIVPTGQTIAISGVLACNNEIYQALAYGGAALTTTGPTFQTGAFRLRVNTDANAGPAAPDNVPGYIAVSMTDARYWLPTNVAVTPGRDVVCPFTAVCTGTFEVEIMMGGTFAWLNPAIT